MNTGKCGLRNIAHSTFTGLRWDGARADDITAVPVLHLVFRRSTRVGDTLTSGVTQEFRSRVCTRTFQVLDQSPRQAKTNVACTGPSW